MKTIRTQVNYVEWLSADQMHQASKEWLSELRFIKDEHLFFEDLIKSFTLQLINPAKFSHNKEIIAALTSSQKKTDFFIDAVKVHKNELQIMVDGIDQLKQEEAYKKEHRGLIVEIAEFKENYRTLKTQLFDVIKSIKKEEKQGRFIDKR